MGSTEIVMESQVRAPIEAVFEALTDHEGMSDWPGVSAATLITEGTPRNGVGAVRALVARGLTLHEEIVHFDAPNRYDYTIVKGLPVKHLGSVRLRSEGELVHVEWKVVMSSRIPFLAQIVGKLLRQGLPKALEHVKREIESAQ